MTAVEYVVRREEAHRERVPAARVNTEHRQYGLNWRRHGFIHLRLTHLMENAVRGSKDPDLLHPFAPIDMNTSMYGDHRDFDDRYPDDRDNRRRDPYDAMYQQQWEDRYKYRGAW